MYKRQVLSTVLFGYPLSPQFVVGAALALASTYMYQVAPAERSEEHELHDDLERGSRDERAAT